MERLKNKVAIITGSSSGFGRAIALRFGAEGARVVCSDLDKNPNPAGFEDDVTTPTDEKIRQTGGEAIYVTCDVTSANQVKELVKAAVDSFGKLDIMVNNAGVVRGGLLFHEFTEADLDACYNVNVKGTFLGSQEAVKQFLAQGTGGNIINIVSTAGLGGYPRQAPYNISKAAVANLTNSLAIEYGRSGIRTNGICPTFCKTSMARGIYSDAAFVKAIADSIPLGRWGEAKDVANMAVFLASDESEFIHGTLIPVDGGERLSRYSV
jgi:NAD(P)-dependent dehydrogenase (short-subunit alcohol dehydrogenase family)